MGLPTNLLKRILRVPANALMASATNLPYTKLSKFIIDEPHLSAKFFPYQPDQPFFSILKTGDHGQEQKGVPPQKLWYGYGETAEEFLNSGKRDIYKMIELLNETGFSFPFRVAIVYWSWAARQAG